MAALDRRLRVYSYLVSLLRCAEQEGISLEEIHALRRLNLRGPHLMQLISGRPVAGVEVTVRRIPGADGEIPACIYTPHGPARSRPLIVSFHGGGFALGDVTDGAWQLSRIARDVDAVVVSAGYRLAPEHRFPAAPDDGYAALRWLGAHAGQLGADGDRIAVMGESAGANLAAVVALMAREYGGPALAHQSLLYPVVDQALSSPSIERNAHAPVLTKSIAFSFRSYYMSGDADEDDWRHSPLRASSHAQLPPALIQIAEYDPLHDDGANYAAVLEAAGVPVRLTEYLGTPHGYLGMPSLVHAAREALNEVISEQARVLETGGRAGSPTPAGLVLEPAASEPLTFEPLPFGAAATARTALEWAAAVADTAAALPVFEPADAQPAAQPADRPARPGRGLAPAAFWGPMLRLGTLAGGLQARKRPESPRP